MLRVIGVLGLACILVWRVLVLAVQPPVTFVPAATLPDDTTVLQARVQAQPTDVKALAQLAAVWQQQRLPSAATAMQLAAQLAPAQPQVQQALADYWLTQNRLDLALQAWLRLLQGRPHAEALLFPKLLEMAEAPNQREVLWAQLPRPLPSWWPRFVSYAAQQTRSLEALGALLHTYKSREAMHPIARQALLTRLERDAPYPYYYAVWLELLSETERRLVRYLYDGHFTQPLSDAGFGWRAVQRPGVSVERFAAPAVGGGRALRVQLAAVAQPGPLVSQALMLGPGRYRLSGEVLLRGLYARGGVEWRLLCAEQANRLPLATGPAWFGDAAWQNFGLDFKLGVECQRPLLQLALRAARQTTAAPQGELWLNRLNLQRVGG